MNGATPKRATLPSRHHAPRLGAVRSAQRPNRHIPWRRREIQSALPHRPSDLLVTLRRCARNWGSWPRPSSSRSASASATCAGCTPPTPSSCASGTCTC
jgi:hypothetical protein